MYHSPADPNVHSTSEGSPRHDSANIAGSDHVTGNGGAGDHMGLHVTSSVGGSSLGTGSLVSEQETDDEISVRIEYLDENKFYWKKKYIRITLKDEY